VNLEITEDDLSDGKIAELLSSHLREMHKYSPPESIHALDMTKLGEETITFWSAREGEKLAGCGALKEISSSMGEIKSMKTDDGYLRKGVAARLLETILHEAKKRSYIEVSLETGSNDSFSPAISLYQRYGFEECPPFASYEPDAYSRFFCKKL
jgi:putative acetyltransferase